MKLNRKHMAIIGILILIWAFGSEKNEITTINSQIASNQEVYDQPPGSEITPIKKGGCKELFGSEEQILQAAPYAAFELALNTSCPSCLETIKNIEKIQEHLKCLEEMPARM